jgi:hypothetical protein
MQALTGTVGLELRRKRQRRAVNSGRDLPSMEDAWSRKAGESLMRFLQEAERGGRGRPGNCSKLMSDEDKPSRTATSDDPEGKAALEMRLRLQRFLHTIEALHDFVEVISPHIQERQLSDSDTPEGFIAALPLDPEDSEKMRTLFDLIGKGSTSRNQKPCPQSNRRRSRTLSEKTFRPLSASSRPASE